MVKSLMVITVAFSSLWAVVGCACFDPDDEFNSAYNAEYEEYSKKVISIMDKIGILDAATLGKDSETEGASARLLSNTYSSNSDEIWDILEDVDDPEVKDLYYTYQDAFEQTYFIPLIVGRAISEYYGEASFYGVKVNTPWNQYVETTKNGNTTTTRVYTPAGEVFDKETFIVMNMNYVSLDNYTLSFLVFNIDESRLYYFNLDHEGNLIAYSYNIDGEEYNNFVLYSHDRFDGYKITDMTICNSIKTLIIDEFRSVNKDSIKTIKNNVSYNIDATKWDWASGYFFGGSEDGHVVDHYSFIDEDSSVLASIGSDGTKTTFTIPRNVRYLSTHLLVGMSQTDKSSDTITLVIPETVRGIKKYDGNRNLIDASTDELIVSTHDGKTLANIQVAQGSPLFMAGEGDLRDLEGNVIYHMNKPVAGGVMDANLMIKKFVGDHSGAVIRDYENKSAYVNSITTLNYELDPNTNDTLERITGLFPNLRTINISGEGEMNNNNSIMLRLASNDITINVNATGNFAISTDFQRIPSNHVLNVLNSNIEFDYYDVSNTVRANVPWSRDYHQLMGNEAPLWRIPIENITFGVDEYAHILSKVNYQKIGNGLKVTIDTTEVSSLTLPNAYYSLEFNEVEIWGSSSNSYISLSRGVDSLTLYNMSELNNYGRSLTIEYEGTYDEFESILNISEYSALRINLICDGFNGEYAYNISKIRVIHGESSEELYKVVYVNEPYTRLSDIPVPNDVNMELYSYYYKDQDQNIYELKYENSYYIDIAMDTLKDLVLTLYKEAKSMNFRVKINDEFVYEEVRNIEKIYVMEVSENGVRQLIFFTEGGSGSPIYRYTLDVDSEWEYDVKDLGNEYTIVVLLY